MVISKQDQTPLDIAGECENYEVVDCIMKHWWTCNVQLSYEQTSKQENHPLKVEKGQILPDSNFGLSESEKQIDNLYINLKYDQIKNSEDIKILRILYWAAFKGHK